MNVLLSFMCYFLITDGVSRLFKGLSPTSMAGHRAHAGPLSPTFEFHYQRDTIDSIAGTFQIRRRVEIEFIGRRKHKCLTVRCNANPMA
jgi:hypothetical protein